MYRRDLTTINFAYLLAMEFDVQKIFTLQLQHVHSHDDFTR